MSQYISTISEFGPAASAYASTFLRSIGGFDLCMAGIFVVIFYCALRRGFSGELSRVIGLVAAITVGLLSFRHLGALTRTIHGVRGNIIPSKFILFAGIIIGCIFLWFCSAKFCEFCLNITVNHKLDMFLGGCLGLIKALSMIFVICSVCYMRPNSESVDQLEQDSWVFRVVKPLVEIVLNRQD